MHWNADFEFPAFRKHFTKMRQGAVVEMANSYRQVQILALTSTTVIRYAWHWTANDEK